jgi:hypothetical protein
MGARLWIDDLREPGPGWVWVKTSADALAFLREFEGTLDEISFDHDLGGEDTTRPVMMWIAEYNEWPWSVFVHTANPVGRDWLVGTARTYGPDGMAIGY